MERCETLSKMKEGRFALVGIKFQCETLSKRKEGRSELVGIKFQHGESARLRICTGIIRNVLPVTQEFPLVNGEENC